ncbi:hypothetical protein Asp14428_58020 [Actinoplanes sp. NBRC 14428]|uniref:Uncharacterized protein DUF1800 n=1 Tax=Pseudosporangium ferrugineum TaxID=439699 RepID=A0A2T0SDN2_9ACTN|nr:uncharacterized protein DUF1800 [Pseudosporangium ferrugineum]BCJ54327.1 hypothetical protein Asp14428_58020 [Actinoplanes sp. NBRC 14428]
MPSDFLPADALSHLLRRATYGPTPASLAEARRLGASAWLERQLAPASIGDKTAEGLVARLPLSALTVDGVRAKARSGTIRQYGWEPMYQLGAATLARAIWSERQLFETMVEFWSNHLHVANPAGDVWESRPDYDRRVIRAYALGRFSDMLKASARHPAMLTYLDNRFSTRQAPNENYGRELLELHTVGLGYTESDVRNAARLLTGLTVNWDTGAYRYDAARHATGAVKVMGFRHANKSAAGGQTAAMALLDHLALHPATARRIATKLCVRFVADDPPASLVTRLAKVYLDKRTAIVPVLRALFTSPEFAASVGAKTRTPYEDLVATVRTLGFGPEPSGTQALTALYWISDSAGQAPMAWAPPNGYPDVASAWASPSGQVIRWNAHLSIAAGWYPTTLQRPGSLLRAYAGSTLPATYGALIDVVANRLLGRGVAPEHSAALAGFFGKTPESRLKPRDAVADWQFPYLVALLLNSPYFALR